MGQTEIDATAMRALKQVLRGQMRAARAALNTEQRADASILISARLRQLLAFLDVAPEDALAIFLAKGEEVNLDATIAYLLEHGQRIVAPVISEAGQPLFYALSSVTSGTHIGAWGVREPIQNLFGRACRPDEIKAIVVPGLAFDACGNRLGYGGGWYDRVLGQALISIGVCYDCQLIAQVPSEAHDQRVAFVVTETQTIKVA